MKIIVSRIAFLLLAFVAVANAGTDPVMVSYNGKIEVKTLQPNMPYVLDRKYSMKAIPKELLLKDVTLVSGGGGKPIKVVVPATTDLYIGIDSGLGNGGGAAVKEYVKKLEAEGWKRFDRITTSDERMKYLAIYKKNFTEKAELNFLGVGFPGTVVIADKIVVGK
jgi:hypothetical protein